MRDMRCMLKWHAYRIATNDSSEKYEVCTRCGAERFPPPISPMAGLPPG